MRVGVVQFAPRFGQPNANRLMLERLTRDAEAHLFVAPELCTSGYQFTSKAELEELAEMVPNGETTQWLIELAQTTGAYFVVGLPERFKETYYNSAVVVGPEGFIGCYRKVHLYNEELQLFSRGKEPYRIYEACGARIGTIICFDWLFPEAMRSLALQGADIVCHPSNLDLTYRPEWMVVRCIENRVFTVTANRTGWEERGGKERMTFQGRSQILSPKGQVLAECGPEDEKVLMAEIDLEQARRKKVTPMNDVLKDRQPDCYTL